MVCYQIYSHMFKLFTTSMVQNYWYPLPVCRHILMHPQHTRVLRLPSPPGSPITASTHMLRRFLGGIQDQRAPQLTLAQRLRQSALCPSLRLSRLGLVVFRRLHLARLYQSSQRQSQSVA